MAQADYQETLSVDRRKLFEAITRYEDYPQFVDGVKKVEVERKGPGKARVRYFVSMMKDIDYTLDHEEDPEKGVVTWKLVTSDFMAKNEGRWTLTEPSPGKTAVGYAIDIDFNFPVPGFILSKLVKGSLPSMVKGFAKRAGGR